ncbi:MAG: hypothetical protein ACC683_11650, partial [Acidimicrobiia bacterium]
LIKVIGVDRSQNRHQGLDIVHVARIPPRQIASGQPNIAKPLCVKRVFLRWLRARGVDPVTGWRDWRIVGVGSGK